MVNSGLPDSQDGVDISFRQLHIKWASARPLRNSGGQGQGGISLKFCSRGEDRQLAIDARL